MTGQPPYVLALTLVLMLCPAATARGGEPNQGLSLLGDENGVLVEVAPIGPAGVEIVRVSQRTIVGSSDGWKPLEEIDDVSEQTKQALLKAAADYYCYDSPGHVRFANAWFLNRDGRNFYTAAHAIVERGELLLGLDRCYLHLLTEPNPYDHSHPVSADVANYGLPVHRDQDGTYGPVSLLVDRAKIPLLGAIPDAAPLTEMGVMQTNGAPLLLVTSRFLDGKPGLLAQHCTLKKKFKGPPGLPGAIFTDCSHFDGNSGGLYLAKDQGSCRPIRGITVCDWKPVAMHSRARQGGPDHGEWDEQTNTAMGVRMDEPGFFDFSPSP